MSVRKATLIVIAISVLGLLAAACGGSSNASSKVPAGAVRVDLAEWGIVANPATAPAGTVTFAVTNLSHMPHEMAVLRTDLAPDKLPVISGIAKETGTGFSLIGRVQHNSKGMKAASFQMTAGKYVLVCNIAGHYEAGMRSAFTVT